MEPETTENRSVTQVSINTDVCTGHGQCYRIAPEIFEPDDDGNGRVLISAVGPELRDILLKAVQLCPEEAIEIKEA